MNTQRTDFDLPENHQNLITPYWLLGIIEGEFFLLFQCGKTVSFRLAFSIGPTIR
jgi:hypothetical protein